MNTDTAIEKESCCPKCKSTNIKYLDVETDDTTDRCKAEENKEKNKIIFIICISLIVIINIVTSVISANTI